MPRETYQTPIDTSLQFLAGWLDASQKIKEKQKQQKFQETILSTAQVGDMEPTIQFDAQGNIKGVTYKPKKVTEQKPEDRLKGISRWAYGMPGGQPPEPSELTRAMPRVFPGPQGTFVGPGPGTQAEFAEGFEPMPLPTEEFGQPALRQQFEGLGLSPEFPGMRTAPREAKPSQTDIYRRDLQEAIKIGDFSLVKEKYPDKLDQISGLERRHAGATTPVTKEPITQVGKTSLMARTRKGFAHMNEATQEIAKQIKSYADLRKLVEKKDALIAIGVDVKGLLDYYAEEVKKLQLGTY